jgi:hypothetical protein
MVPSLLILLNSHLITRIDTGGGHYVFVLFYSLKIKDFLEGGVVILLSRYIPPPTSSWWSLSQLNVDKLRGEGT